MAVHFGSCARKILTMYTVHIAWRKCLRKIMQVPYRTRSKYVPSLADSDHFFTLLYKRFSSFWHSCVNSTNSIIKFASQMITDSRSNAATNVRQLMFYMKSSNSSFDNCTIAHLKHTLHYALDFDLSQEEICNIQAIKDLCTNRANATFVFDQEEIDFCIYYLCVMT